MTLWGSDQTNSQGYRPELSKVQVTFKKCVCVCVRVCWGKEGRDVLD